MKARLAVLRGVDPNEARWRGNPALQIRDLADMLGVSPALLYSFARGAQGLSKENQQRLSRIFQRIDSGDLAKERDGGGRWVLRPVRHATLAQVVAAPGQKTLSIKLTEDGPRLKV